MGGITVYNNDHEEIYYKIKQDYDGKVVCSGYINSGGKAEWDTGAGYWGSWTFTVEVHYGPGARANNPSPEYVHRFSCKTDSWMVWDEVNFKRKDDTLRNPSPCARREHFEKQLKTSIRRGGHYSSALGSKGPSGGPADHDWIYVGGGYVVDIPGPGYLVTKREMNPSGYVTERVSPSQLALNSAINAEGQGWNYHMRNNNCQHFAYWCSKGHFYARTVFNKGNDDINNFCPEPAEPPPLEKRFTGYSLYKKMTRPNPF